MPIRSTKGRLSVCVAKWGFITAHYKDPPACNGKAVTFKQETPSPCHWTRPVDGVVHHNEIKWAQPSGHGRPQGGRLCVF